MPAVPVRAAWRVVLSRALVLGLCLAAAACGREIGDQCRVSDDCVDNQLDRQCDTSQPGGYCTVIGCDQNSCPDEAACIRFFPVAFLKGLSCDDRNPNVTTCPPDQLCVQRVCVPRASERRYCARSCDDDGDCREEYECRETGRNGAEPLTSEPGRKEKYCAPRAAAPAPAAPGPAAPRDGATTPEDAAPFVVSDAGAPDAPAEPLDAPAPPADAPAAPSDDAPSPSAADAASAPTDGPSAGDAASPSSDALPPRDGADGSAP
jgi:hypothetical protein